MKLMRHKESEPAELLVTAGILTLFQVPQGIVGEFELGEYMIHVKLISQGQMYRMAR